MQNASSRHVFLSYARKDGAFALQLARAMKADGIACWIDQEDIPPGAQWDSAVQSALAQAEVVFVVLTPASVASPNVLDEIAFSLDRTKAVVPILKETCDLPLRLIRLQYLDFRGDFSSAYDRHRSALAKFVTLAETLGSVTPAAPVSHGSGKLVLTRPSSYWAMMRTIQLVLNGKEIGRIGNGQTLEVPAAAGEVVLEAKLDWGGSNPLRFTLVPGATAHVEVKLQLAGTVLGSLGTEVVTLKRTDAGDPS